MDWENVIVRLDRLARTGAETPRPTTPAQPRPQLSDDPNPQNLGNAWFGVAPRVSIVARDWFTSSKLIGELSPIDTIRLSASTQMVVGRARLNNARFTPFLQVGLGQWRVDRTLLPFTPHTIEVASQVGTGFELRLMRQWQVAAEISATTLLRDGNYANSGLPHTALWSSYLTSRLQF